MPATTTTEFTAPPGGVMTRQAGAVTGDLTCKVTPGGTHPRVQVAYTGSEDWYDVQGTPGAEVVDAETAAKVLSADPGVDGSGNPAATRF